MKITELNQNTLDTLFAVYRAVTKSHWKPNPLAEVQRSLHEQGKFERVAGTPENWSTKLVIQQLPSSELDIRVEVNPALPPALKVHAERVQATFKAGLEKELGKKGLEGHEWN